MYSRKSRKENDRKTKESTRVVTAILKRDKEVMQKLVAEKSAENLSQYDDDLLDLKKFIETPVFKPVKRRVENPDFSFPRADMVSLFGFNRLVEVQFEAEKKKLGK